MKHQTDLLNGNIFSLFSRFLISSVTGMLIISIYILFDTIFIGRGLGSEGLAALSMVLPVFCLLYGTGMLLGMGGSTVLSIYLGQKDERMAKVAFTHAWVATLIIGLLLSLLGTLFIDPLCYLLGADANSFTMVKDYLKYIVLFGFSFVIVNAMTIFIRNDHSPRWAMSATVFGGITNIVLDYIFIFPLNGGMAGGAIATVISSTATMLLLLMYLIKGKKTLILTKTKLILPLIRRIFINGFSSFVIEVSSGIVILAFNHVILSTIGEIGVSAYSIIANISLICVAIFTGIAQGIQPLISINYGANQLIRVRKFKHLALLSALLTGILFFTTGYLFPNKIVALFIQNDPALTAITITGMKYYFIAFLIMGLNIVLGAYKQSIEVSAHSNWISISRGIAFVLIGLIFLPLIFTTNAIWLTIPFAEACTLLLCLLLNLKR